MMKNLSFIKFLFKNMVYFYAMAVLICCCALGVLIMNEFESDPTCMLWVENYRNVIYTCAQYFKFSAPLFGILYLLIDDLSKVRTPTEQEIFNPFSKIEWTIWLESFRKIAASSNSWWYKILQLDFLIFFLIPSRLLLNNFVSFYLPQTTFIMFFFLLFEFGMHYPEDVESLSVLPVTYIGAFSIYFMNLILDHYIFSLVSIKYKNVITSLSIDSQTLNFFTRNFSGSLCLSPNVRSIIVLYLFVSFNVEEVRQATNREVFFQKQINMINEFEFEYTPEEFKECERRIKQIGASFCPTNMKVFISFLRMICLS